MKTRILLSKFGLPFLFLCSFPMLGQQKGSEANPYDLNATSKTVSWGRYWAEAEPVLTVKSGDYVKVHTLLTSNPRRLEASGVSQDLIEPELREIQKVDSKDRGPGGHVNTGPIYIEGAEPGDVLEVKIKSIDLAIPYGYNGIGGNGFMSDEIFVRGSRIIYFDMDRMVGKFSDSIEIPLKPFFGSMGVAPMKEVGRWNSAPPWRHAGNMDNKELVAGSSVFIPVFVKGALFQVGDGHAAQGNGEVDITAIETSLRGELQLIVHKDMKLDWPMAETPTHIITMGMDRDITIAARTAVREMIGYLTREKGMSIADAYSLCSVAMDLNTTQLVDGNVGFHAMISKAIFIKP